MTDLENSAADRSELMPVARLAAEWGLLAAAGVAALGALGRMLGHGGPGERFGPVTLAFVAVAGGLCAVRFLRLGPAAAESPETAGLRERQRALASRLHELSAALPLLLPENEARHLGNLSDKLTENYRGGPSLREELRRLRAMGLIVRKGDRGIDDLHDRLTFDLAEVVEPTETGRYWAARLREFRHGPDDAPLPDPAESVPV